MKAIILQAMQPVTSAAEQKMDCMAAIYADLS
jgi:hypothetical protein